MRSAVVLAIGAAILVLVGWSFLGGGKDRCELFAADLKLAVLEPTKAPDPDDRDALTDGSCSTIITRTFEARALGWSHESEHTVAGRIFLMPGNGRRLVDATRAASEDQRDASITPLRGLGPGAFVVTRTRPRPRQPEDFGGPSDPAGALSLPATAYWVNDRDVFIQVSATRDGATVAQSRRATERLARLTGRRPVDTTD